MKVAALGAERADRQYLLCSDEDTVGCLCGQQIGVPVAGDSDLPALFGQRSVDKAEVGPECPYGDKLALSERRLERA
jgi:hypothetical protein